METGSLHLGPEKAQYPSPLLGLDQPVRDRQPIDDGTGIIVQGAVVALPANNPTALRIEQHPRISSFQLAGEATVTGLFLASRKLAFELRQATPRAIVQGVRIGILIAEVHRDEPVA